MTLRTLAAAALAAALATPALAQGLDSRHSPFPPSAYPGYVGDAVLPTAHVRPAPAYRYSGPHAGGPADALPRT